MSPSVTASTASYWPNWIREETDMNRKTTVGVDIGIEGGTTWFLN